MVKYRPTELTEKIYADLDRLCAQKATLQDVGAFLTINYNLTASQVEACVDYWLWTNGI